MNMLAFPCVSGLSTQEGSYLQEGMTLRDYLAAKAMQGLLAAHTGLNPHQIATLAYELADAMLNERLKNK